MIFSERNHIGKALDPVADALAGTKNTDIFSMKNHGHATFIMHKGVGVTGTTVIKAQACDDVVPSNTEDVPFHYREVTTGDTPGALKLAAAAGFTITAGSSGLVIVEVDSKRLAASGFQYVRLNMVEGVDSPILAGITVILSESRYAQNVQDTAIV